jgi:hypothetical protein
VHFKLRGECNWVLPGRVRVAENGIQLPGKIGKRTSRNRHLSIFLMPVTALVSCFGLPACSTNSTLPATPIISVTMMQSPPSSLSVGGSVPVSATVRNDVANAGVDWVAICGSAPNCGSFSPAHTASGNSTTFTAPPDVPAGNTVAVTALSTTDHSKASAATATITSTVTGVTITQQPPSSAPASAIVSLSASVAGDQTNGGVDWTAACTNVPCGGFGTTRGQAGGSTTHTASGSPVFFTLPGILQFPAIVGSSVTVTATSTTDANFKTTATILVTSPVIIMISRAPPSTLLTNATAPVAAVMTNDTTNSGVDWSVQCQNAPCGSFSAVHTASGAPTTFTAPNVVPAPNGSVTIIATSTADLSTAATVTITIVVPISVQISQQVPNNTMVVNATAPLVAMVDNDAANAGVDWSVTCGSAGACGSFSLSPAHTPSGGTITFTAPAAVPTGGTVTITAKSTTDKNQSATEIVTVTAAVPPNSLLTGQFVFLLTGQDSNQSFYSLGGTIIGDGNGNVTGGEVDIADAGGNNAAVVGVLASTYSIGTDGRGQIQLTVNTALLGGNFGVNNTGTITMSVVFVTPQHALLSETDGFGSGTGTLDFQNAADLAAFTNGTAGLNGTYTLTLSGAEAGNPNAKFFTTGALVFQFASGTLRETGFVADQSDNGIVRSAPAAAVLLPIGGNQPDPNGRLLDQSSIDLGLPIQFQIAAYMIDANHFVVVDFRDSSTFIFGGYLVAQPSSPAISGTYAFAETGATTSLQPQAAGGIVTCGSTGTLDVAPLSGTPTTNQAITAACTAPASGRGLITISGAGTTGVSKFAAYPTLDKGLQLMELDGGSSGTSGPSGAGVALEQTVASAIPVSIFSGKYASNFLAHTLLGIENFAAQVVSDGVSSLSGTADVNSFNTTAPAGGTPSSNATLSGSFTAHSNGRFPLIGLTFTPSTGQPPPEITTINPVCYIVDANTCLLVGLDATAPGSGLLQLQHKLGL